MGQASFLRLFPQSFGFGTCRLVSRLIVGNLHGAPCMQRVRVSRSLHCKNDQLVANPPCRAAFRLASLNIACRIHHDNADSVRRFDV